MWPFLKHKRSALSTYVGQEDGFAKGSEVTRKPLKFAQLVAEMGNFKDLAVHDTALKIWLPQPVKEALDELCSRHGDSVSESLRQMLAHHCYGIYAFTVMLEQHPDIFQDDNFSSRVMFSRMDERPEASAKKRVVTYWVPELGKNVEPIKLWISTRLRNDLQILADHVGVKLSQYVREVVIARMLGHGTLPYRPKMLDAVPLAAIEAWCDGEAVPMREVTESEFSKSPLGEICVEDDVV